MPKLNLLQEGKSYTFRSYFEFNYEVDDIIAEFDYSLIRSKLSLPKTTAILSNVAELKQKIADILPFVSLSSETARRETLVSPVLLEIVRFCHCQLRIEYPLIVNNWLKGHLDYLLQSNKSLLVIEAKKDDLTRGFTQLAVELIALAQVESQEIYYGAVTIGNLWQFGRLDCIKKEIVQDLNLWRVPDDLDDLMPILVGILS